MKYVHINYVGSSLELVVLSVELSECLALTSYFEDYSIIPRKISFLRNISP